MNQKPATKPTPAKQSATPKIGMRTTIHNQAARIIAVLPAGTIDVERISDGRCFRITGLSF